MPEDIAFLGIQEDDSLYTSVVKDGLKNRILILNQSIDDCVVESYIYYIIKWNCEDFGLPKDKRKPIKIMVNSQGGDTFSGRNFIDIIENSVTPVIAVAMGFVASMAFDIYVGCHTRIAFKNSIFLQHDGSMVINNSTGKARNTMDFFDGVEERTKEYILKHTQITDELYEDHYGDEWFMYADEAKSVGCVDMIVGEDISFEEVFCE